MFVTIHDVLACMCTPHFNACHYNYKVKGHSVTLKQPVTAWITKGTVAKIVSEAHSNFSKLISGHSSEAEH